MITVIIIIHIIAAIFLIAVILLQAGKGAEMGAVFGGGSSQAIFGPSGAAPLFSKLTSAAAIIFMLTCLVLAYHSSKSRTIMPKSEQGQEQPLPATGTEQGAPSTAPSTTPGQTGNTTAQQPGTAPSASQTQTQAPENSGNPVDQDQNE